MQSDHGAEVLGRDHVFKATKVKKVLSDAEGLKKQA